MDERNETLEERNIRVAKELEDRAVQDETAEAHEVMADVSEALSIREQLLQRTQRRVFYTPVDQIDDEGEVIGEIVIQTRMMTGSERERAILLMNELQKQRDAENRDILVYNTTTKGFAEILAIIAIDDSVKEYFKAGEATDDVTIAVLSSSMEQSLAAIGDNLSRFREERNRPDPT